VDKLWHQARVGVVRLAVVVCHHLGTIESGGDVKKIYDFYIGDPIENENIFYL
jgi:hypothetical protein